MAQRIPCSSRPVRRTTPPVQASPACPLAAEIAALRARMLERNSPGARLIIARMEAYDVALDALCAAQDDFRPGDHRGRYAADRATLRFIWLKQQQIMATLVAHLHSVAKAVEPFDLTEANTVLPVEPPWVEAWYATRRRDAQHEARLARAERAARRRISQRASSQAATTRASTRAKTRTGGDR